MSTNRKTLALRSNLIIGQTFAALRHYNYRLWFAGQLVSLIGTWMQSTAQGYLVYTLTESPRYLGYVSAAAGLPSIVFTLTAGVIADRMSRRTLMVITQTAMMILAFVQAALTFSGLIQPWHIIVLAALFGIAQAFDAPTRQSFVLEMVDRKDLTNAVALNATMFNLAIIIGPAIGGLMYAAVGPGWCFALNGVSFIAIIIALMLMRIQLPAAPARQASAFTDLKVGLKFVLSHRVIRLLIINNGVFSLLGLGMITLMPAWAVEILKGDSATNGYLLSARGAGAVVSALMLASIGSRRIRGKIWTIGSFLLPICMMVFSAVRVLPLSIVILAGIGWCFMALANSTNAMVQTLVPDELRGRVMGIYTLVFFGAMPIGSYFAGELAERFGEARTVLFNALLLLAFAILVKLLAPFVSELE